MVSRSIRVQSLSWRLNACRTLAMVFLSGPLALFAQNSQPAADAVIAKGVQLLRGGQALQAKEKFDTAIRDTPGSADALTWRGITENQLEQYDAAAADFEAALKLSPAMLAAHYNFALTLIRLRKVGEAIQQLQIVVAAQPNSVQTRYNLAILLEGKGLWKEAAEQLSFAHTIDPVDAGVVLHLLKDELRLKDVTHVSSLTSALAAPSTPPEIQRDAASSLLDAGRSSDAARMLETLHERLPADHPTTSLLARAYIGVEKDEEATSLLESLPETERDEEDIYFLGLAYESRKNLSRAATEFRKAVQADPKDARPLYHLGLLLAASPEKREKSIDTLRVAVKLDPGNERYVLALARVLLVEDRAGEASELLATIAPTSELTAQVQALRGVAFAATHKQAEAIPALRKAIALDPLLSLAQNVLGFCLFQQGLYTEAAEAYGKASKLEPTRPLYARDAALAYQRANQQDRALEFAETASALGPTDASDHLMLGKLYVSTHRSEDAVRELLRAASLNPDLDSADYLLARTYMQMGDRQQAALWSARLTALKQKHEADSVNVAPSVSVHSSTLLTGGSLASDDVGAP